MRQSDNEELYWSLVIEPSWTQASIWRIDKKSKGVEVIATSPPTHWDTESDLVSSVDTSLSAATQNLPENYPEPSKTVFGVPPSWVSEGQIKRDYLDKIKIICSKLSLNPSGFVVLPEAIAHYIKVEEGSPLNAVIVGIGENLIDVTVFKFGNLAGSSTVSRSVSIVEDIVEGLVRFAGSGSPLPSRFLLYDGKEGELDLAKQTLIEADWSEKQEKLKFLHIPKVEIIESEKKVLAVSLAGASEIGGVSSVVLKKDMQEVSKNEEVESNVTSDDIPSLKYTGTLGPEDVGFVVDKDVSSIKNSEAEVINESQKGQEKTISKFSLFSGFLIKVKNFLQIGTRPPIKRSFVIGGVLIIVLVAIGFSLWWFLPTAIVTIYVAPQKLEEKGLITIDPVESDLDKGILKGKVLDTEVSGQKTRNTTGTKTIGEKAKGSVEIRNGTSLVINLASGTVLLGPNDLNFALDQAVSVSAALSPSTPGTVSVGVAAQNIGAEYNLAKDESFKVGNYPKSDVDAVAESDFSGGSSREIIAVSVNDRKLVEEELVNELTDKGRSELENKTTEEDIFIPESVVATASARNFSNKVGDESSTIKLSLSLLAKGLSILKSDLNTIAKNILKDKIPSGFALREDQIESKFTPSNDKKIDTFEVEFSINLVPEIKVDEIAKSISGKNPDSAKEYLTSIPGFTRAEIRLKPRFPGALGSLPRVVKNITIEVTAEE